MAEYSSDFEDVDDNFEYDGPSQRIRMMRSSLKDSWSEPQHRLTAIGTADTQQQAANTRTTTDVIREANS